MTTICQEEENKRSIVINDILTVMNLVIMIKIVASQILKNYNLSNQIPPKTI